MCRCTPAIRTPFCGKPGCEWPPQKPFTLGIVESLPSLRELLENAVVLSVTEEPEWVTLELNNGVQVMFQAGAVIVHPERN